jgi:hypothetical protein
MEIKLTKKESEEYFHNALCNGLSEMGGYGLTFDYVSSEYKKSREKLTNPCFEDVLMQMLRDGYKITFIDEECDGEYTSSIGMKEIHERVAKTPIQHLTDMINENDDAVTADVILQSVFFDAVIFG